MAKVTIFIEDVEKDGEDGLAVDVKFDPELGDLDLEDPTLAQTWGAAVMQMIAKNAGRVDYVNDDGEVISSEEFDNDSTTPPGKGVH
jgi:hypothetical protein